MARETMTRALPIDVTTTELPDHTRDGLPSCSIAPLACAAPSDTCVDAKSASSVVGDDGGCSIVADRDGVCPSGPAAADNVVMGINMSAPWKDEDMLVFLPSPLPSTLQTRPLYVLKTASGLNAYFDSKPALEQGVTLWRAHCRDWFVRHLLSAVDVRVHNAPGQQGLLSSNQGNISGSCPPSELVDLLAFIRRGCAPEQDVDKFFELCMPFSQEVEIVEQKLIASASRPTLLGQVLQSFLSRGIQ